MKKLGLLASVCLLSLGVFAQDYCIGPTCPPKTGASAGGWETYPMPQQVAQALFAGTNEASTKGLVIVEVGAANCMGCKLLLKTLQSKGILSFWKEKGVRFYQWDGAQDDQNNRQTFSGKFGVTLWPSLLFFRDGELVKGPWSEQAFRASDLKAETERWLK